MVRRDSFHIRCSGYGARGLPNGSYKCSFLAAMFWTSTKHKGDMFRVPLIDKWVVVLTGPRLVEELRKVPEEDLSFDHAVRDVSSEFFCVPSNVYGWHITQSFFRSSIRLASTSKNIPIMSKLFAIISPETSKGFFLMFMMKSPTPSAPLFRRIKVARFITSPWGNSYIPFRLGWAKVCVHQEITKAMCRISNRIFVGLPLCE